MLENYQKLEDIGKGSFGRVSKVRRVTDGRVLVQKELDYGKMSDKEKQQIVAEVNILRDLQHPNIVRYYDRCIDKKNLKLYIIMEYCEKGDLQQVIKRCIRNKELIQEQVIWRILAQIVSGLYFCHRRSQQVTINRGEAAKNVQPQDVAKAVGSQRILHRDLKPGNIFLDANSNAKLGDFGLARVLNHGSVFAQTNVGTPYYMSPEQINEQRYNEKSDIWSLGCLTYEMAALRPPFKAQNQLALALKIKEGSFERIPSLYSKDLWRIIQTMLQQNPEERVDVDDLVLHPLIIQHLDSNFRKQLENKAPKNQVSTSESHKLMAIQERLRNKEVQLKERETFVREKEQFLHQKEDELLQRERALDSRFEQKTQELSEKEDLLNEILRRYELPLLAGDLRKALQTAVERTSQGSTCGCGSLKCSISHNLKDSKQFCSESFSPLKSGGYLSMRDHQQFCCSKEFGFNGVNSEEKVSSVELKTSQAILNSLNSKGFGHKGALQTLQSSSSPRNFNAHYHTVKGQQLLKNNKSDPNMRSLPQTQCASQADKNFPCQTSVKKLPQGTSSLSNYQQYATQTRVAQPIETSEQIQTVRSPKNNTKGDLGGSPMEILKRFKMQKRVSQQQQKVTLTTVEDDTLNEQDMPCEDELHQDSTFRDTVFNPKQTNPTNLLSHRGSNTLQLKRTETFNQKSSNQMLPLETLTSMGTLSQFKTVYQSTEQAFNRTFDHSKLAKAGLNSSNKQSVIERAKKQVKALQRTNSAQGSTSLQALLQTAAQNNSDRDLDVEKYKTYDGRLAQNQVKQKSFIAQAAQQPKQVSAFAMQRQRSMPNASSAVKINLNKTLNGVNSLQALLLNTSATGHEHDQQPATTKAIHSARDLHLPPKNRLTVAQKVPQKSLKLQRPGKTSSSLHPKSFQ